MGLRVLDHSTTTTSPLEEGTSMAAIAEGDRVKLHYTGRLEDGTEFDSSLGREPLEFVAGSQELIPGVSRGVIGMDVGEKKTVTCPPAEAYGERHEGLEFKVERSQIPEEAAVGAVLGLEAEGQQMRALLVELSDDHAVLDANHPLAGKTLVFDLEIVAVGE
jgi:peptidylprolyl isomerase